MKILVTRHPAMLAYIYELGLVSEHESITVIERIESGAEVKDHDVIGIIPNRFACEAKSVTEIPLFIPNAQRGVVLSLDQIREFAGDAIRYKIQCLD